ncbi:MAG: acetylglutamate kinase [Methanosarcinales archaeon Met12]|nr:MAG: acetylglutamate kinase [Methanosarcinales archaeon Met12]
MKIKPENALIGALPHIKKFYNSIIVVKIGGHAIVKPIIEEIVKDIVLLYYVGMKPIIIHGGGPEITRKMEKDGKKPKFVGGLRITDDDTLDIVRTVLTEDMNPKIVSLINKHGAKGLGLSGRDGQLITAKKKVPQKIKVNGVEQDVDLGRVGEVETINPEVLRMAIEEGYIPVIAPIAPDAKGNDLNLNADTVAGDIAIAIKSKKLIVLTDVPGVLRNPSDPDSLISSLSIEEANEMIGSGSVQKGMLPKVKACMRAIDGSVEKAHIIDGNRPHSLLLELFTDEGIGTMMFAKI